MTTKERLIACGEQCVKIGLFKEAIEGWIAAGDTARLASLGSHLFDTNNYRPATECFKAAGEPMKMFLSAQCDFVNGRYDAINDMALLGEAPTHAQFLQCGNSAWRLQKWQHAIWSQSKKHATPAACPAPLTTCAVISLPMPSSRQPKNTNAT